MGKCFCARHGLIYVYVCVCFVESDCTREPKLSIRNRLSHLRPSFHVHKHGGTVWNIACTHTHPRTHPYYIGERQSNHRNDGINFTPRKIFAIYYIQLRLISIEQVIERASERAKGNEMNERAGKQMTASHGATAAPNLQSLKAFPFLY